MTTILPNAPCTLILAIGEQLTVVADANSTGRVWPFSEQLGDTPGLTAVAASTTVTLGPFGTEKRYQVDCLTGSLAVTQPRVDFPTAAEALAAAATAAAVAAALLYVPVSGTIGDLVEMIGAGVPTNGTTGATIVGPGSRYTDITNANIYVNANTKASPTWKLVTRAA
jgi:hypothetical protein